MHGIGRAHRLDQIIDASHLLADGGRTPAETSGATAERGDGGPETNVSHDASFQRPRQRRQTHEVKTSPYGQKTAGKDELWDVWQIGRHTGTAGRSGERDLISVGGFAR
jgi:hypothetical protein